MEYIYKQKFSMRNQPFNSLFGATVLLVEPETEACAIYSRQLQGVNMNVLTCGTLSDMLGRVRAESPDIVIVNPTGNIAQGIKFVTLLKTNFPVIPVITIGKSIRESHLDAIMKAGVSFHINRQFTQPRDILLAVEQALSRN